jgi:hypothetical protein
MEKNKEQKNEEQKNEEQKSKNQPPPNQSNKAIEIKEGNKNSEAKINTEDKINLIANKIIEENFGKGYFVINNKVVEELKNFNKKSNTNFIIFLQEVINKKNIPTYLPCYELENWKLIFEKVLRRIFSGSLNNMNKIPQENINKILGKIPTELGHDVFLKQYEYFSSNKKYEEAINSIKGAIKTIYQNKDNLGKEGYRDLKVQFLKKLNSTCSLINPNSYEKEIKSLEQEMKEMPRGNIREDQHLFNLALDHLQSSNLGYQSNNPGYQSNNLGYQLNNLGKAITLIKDAIKKLEELKKDKKIDDKTYSHQKELYSFNGNSITNIKNIKQYQYSFNEGLLCLELANLEVAIQHFQNAVEFAISDEERNKSIFNLGLTKMKLANYKEASEHFEILKISKEENQEYDLFFCDISFNLALCKLKLKEYKEAAELFISAIKELGKINVEPHQKKHILDDKHILNLALAELAYKELLKKPYSFGFLFEFYLPNNIEKKIEYLKKIIDEIEKNKDNTDEIIYLNQKGKCLSLIGSAQLKLAKNDNDDSSAITTYDSAFKTLQEAIKTQELKIKLEKQKVKLKLKELKIKLEKQKVKLKLKELKIDLEKQDHQLKLEESKIDLEKQDPQLKTEESKIDLEEQIAQLKLEELKADDWFQQYINLCNMSLALVGSHRETGSLVYNFITNKVRAYEKLPGQQFPQLTELEKEGFKNTRDHHIENLKKIICEIPKNKNIESDFHETYTLIQKSLNLDLELLSNPMRELIFLKITSFINDINHTKILEISNEVSKDYLKKGADIDYDWFLQIKEKTIQEMQERERGDLIKEKPSVEINPTSDLPGKLKEEEKQIIFKK